jgi:bla regulator protein BlaR1
MLAWMLYVIMVTLLLSAGAYVAERAARLKRGGTRWIWITAIVASLLIPTVIASVSVQLPSILAPQVAQKVVVLRDVTTQALSPLFWISGSAAEPAGWRDLDALMTNLWRGASAAMLLALVVSGVLLFLRKRRWRRSSLANTEVYVTDDVGPAVVGLLRPRIVVPRWVTMALPSHQNAVLAHEQAHLDARDPQLFTFALALLVFMPWNLPLWWQLRRLRYAIEVDCDARVLRGGMDPANYGETLIAVGERQSAYIGAVAAMSESRSFLEERIRIMISHPVKWRRIGIAALASLSIGLTALAAQVSPPNKTEAPASVSEIPRPHGQRVAVKLPANVLDRYTGTYRMNDQNYLSIRRDGDSLLARITGQPEFEIYAEAEDQLFWKIVDARLVFVNDGSGLAPSAMLHQHGHQIPMARVDASEAIAVQQALDARIQAQTPSPGSEAALRRTIAAMSSGQINYDDMEPMLADATRAQEEPIRALMKQFGEVKTITFKGVGDAGWDSYEVQHANGRLSYRIAMASNGKIAGLLTMATP